MCQVCPRRFETRIVEIPQTSTMTRKFSYAQILRGDCGEVISGRYVGEPWTTWHGVRANLPTNC